MGFSLLSAHWPSQFPNVSIIWNFCFVFYLVFDFRLGSLRSSSTVHTDERCVSSYGLWTRKPTGVPLFSIPLDVPPSICPKGVESSIRTFSFKNSEPLLRPFPSPVPNFINNALWPFSTCVTMLPSDTKDSSLKATHKPSETTFTFFIWFP